MSSVRQVVRYAGLGLAMGLLGASIAAADTTTERPSSVLVFPKIVFDSGQDTLIQISNTSNSVVHAHCFYVNAMGSCQRSPNTSCVADSDCGTMGPCNPGWQEIDYDILLTKQQPTHWAAGLGRLSDPTDSNCRVVLPDHNGDINDCYGAGMDPGRIPPVADPFRGELKCIEVDPSGAPISGNHLKGEATIVTANGGASKYNAVGVLGLDSNDGDNILCLGGGADDQCPRGAEYNACPEAMTLNHFAEGADNPLLGPTSQVRTELTLVPCTENFETQAPTKVIAQFQITNEFEETFSASTTVACWGNFFLDQINMIFDVSRLGTRVVQTRIRPATGSSSGLVGISEEYHSVKAVTGATITVRAAFGLSQEGDRQATDLIVIPEGP